MLLDSFQQPWDYELLDTGNGYRLERWGDTLLARPDPQIIWPRSLPDEEWEKATAKFITGKGEEKGKWELKGKIPSPWIIENQSTKFLLKLSPFKHTGLFAEQAAQWEWMTDRLQIKDNRLKKENASLNLKTKILNLFSYTGGATMVLAKAGCQVTHVDASKPSITWANENYKLNFKSKNPPLDFARDEHPQKGNVRWMLDDAVKFVKREVKRGSKYEGIIMDPPAFGHSPDGKTWKFNQDLPGLLADCVKLLSGDAKFLVINGYATNSSALALNNLLEDAVKDLGGKIEFGELCLKHPIRNKASNEARKSERLISTGIFARWSH